MQAGKRVATLPDDAPQNVVLQSGCNAGQRINLLIRCPLLFLYAGRLHVGFLLRRPISGMLDRTNLQLITERLPFAIDDADAVNELYASCGETPTRSERQHIELWTYGYIYRYMAAKYAGGSIRQMSDMEELVSTVYEKVQDGRSSIRNPDKYAHWVSVVAKNTFINYVNRHRVETTSIHEPQPPTLKQAGAVEEIDANVGLMRTQLQTAIRRLPPYLRRVAELYYFEECTFKEIADRIDKDVPVVRTYKSRALKALREDTRLQAVLEEP